MNEAVLQAIEFHALTPEAVEHVVKLTERDDLQEQRDRLERELKDSEKRIRRLVAALEDGDESASLRARLRELEAARDAKREEIASLRPVPRVKFEVVQDRLSEWRRLLRGSTTQARAVIQRVVRGRITFTPAANGRGYEFAAETRFDKLFMGVATPRPSHVADSAAGLETLRREDTLEGDWGRLLERAYQRQRGCDPGGTPTVSR